MSGYDLRAARGDHIFKIVVYVSSIFVILMVVAIAITLFVESYPILKSNGIGLITGKVWDPVGEKYSVLPFVVGTLVTSFLSLLISIPFSVSVSIFLGEYISGKKYSRIVKSAVNLIAGVPSIIYGFWGLVVLVPAVRALEEVIGVDPVGIGIFTASLILSVMIVPYTTSIGQEVIRLVPQDIKEAAYAMGATRFELIRHIILPYVRSGIFAGILLSFGRAFGETMAVTMVIGNANYIPRSIFAPGNTMASVIANEFTEATSELHLSALVSLGLVLLVISFITGAAGRYFIKNFSSERVGR